MSISSHLDSNNCCSCNDLDKRPDKEVLRLPSAMVTLDLLMAASTYVDKWGLVDVGQLGPAARTGWFVPARCRH